jgi:phosphoenolpyruvate-protein kinase (PTS system EI component)
MAVQGVPYVPGIGRGRVQFGTGPADAGRILVLSPGELPGVRADRLPAGVIVVGGAPLSHPMIRLLGLGRPTVILGPGQVSRLVEGRPVAVDGSSGRVAEPETLPETSSPEAGSHLVAGRSVTTADGVPVALRASVAGPSAAAWARARGAEAVGLVRSEYLTPRGKRAPDRAYYHKALGAIAEAAAPLAVTVRLLDLAPDKAPDWLPETPGFATALGRHGSRLFGMEPVRSAFLAEAEALAALAPRTSLGAIVPFLTEVGEYRRWRDTLRGILPDDVAVGAMLETPAAVQEAGTFLAEGDFAAIGCNDLMQTFFAADRDTPEVADLLNPYSPVILRFLHRAAEGAGAGARERITLCGLLPQMPGLLPVLLGMGFRTFSVEPALLPQLAAVVAGTDLAEAGRRAEAACAAAEPAEVQEALGLPAGAPWGAEP